jgi:hypothetical protein
MCARVNEENSQQETAHVFSLLVCFLSSHPHILFVTTFVTNMKCNAMGWHVT